MQIIELSEPLFAGVIAFIFLNEQPSWLACVGGLLIMIGIAMANGLLPIKFWKKDWLCLVYKKRQIVLDLSSQFIHSLFK